MKPKSLEIAAAEEPTVQALDDRKKIWSIAGMIIDRRN